MVLTPGSSRLAEYLDSASTGEGSLAVLEAVDAVNLMTIHTLFWNANAVRTILFLSHVPNI